MKVVNKLSQIIYLFIALNCFVAIQNCTLADLKRSTDPDISNSSFLSPEREPSNTEVSINFFDPTLSEKKSIETLYYVDRNHPRASDGNDGSEAKPWKTIVHAATQATAGHTILIKEGVYEDGAKIRIKHSGTDQAWIKFKAYPGDERKVVIKKGGFISEGNSYILIEGLKFLQSPSKGIQFTGGSNHREADATHIIIRNNHTYKTCSSAISVWGVDWGKDPGSYDNIKNVVIENNLLEYGTTGCKNEIITVANGASNILVRYNEIRLGDPAYEGGDEGIDFKEGVVDSAIYGNYIHHLADKAIYLDGGSSDDFPNRDPQVKNIHIFNNLITDIPSAGIVIQTEGRGDVQDIMIYNNIVAFVTGSGYRIYDHPGGVKDGGTISRIFFYNNIAYHTGLKNSYFNDLDTNDKATPKGGGFASIHPGAKKIVFKNNISWNNGAFDFKLENQSNNTTSNNICLESVCEIRQDPGFKDPKETNFTLAKTSVAIDAGKKDLYSPALDYNGNTRDNLPDIGPFEHE